MERKLISLAGVQIAKCRPENAWVERLESRQLLSAYSIINTGLTVPAQPNSLYSENLSAHINNLGEITGYDPATGQPAVLVPTSGGNGDVVLLGDNQTLLGGKPQVLAINDLGQILLDASQSLSDPSAPNGKDVLPVNYLATLSGENVSFALPTQKQLKADRSIDAEYTLGESIDGPIYDWSLAAATVLNNNGTAAGVGAVLNPNGNTALDAWAFAIEGDTVPAKPLGNLGNTSIALTYYSDTFAAGINSSGVIVGQADTLVVNQKLGQFANEAAFPVEWVYDRHTKNYNVVQLTPSRDGNGAAFGINDSGEVVGDFGESSKSPAVTIGFIETPPSKHHAASVFSVAPIAGDNIDDLFAVNNAGVAVGDSSYVNKEGAVSNVHAMESFINHRGKVDTIDLNTLLPANSGWVLNTATGINNNGQIIGLGTYNGQRRVFLLNPPGISNA